MVELVLLKVSNINFRSRLSYPFNYMKPYKPDWLLLTNLTFDLRKSENYFDFEKKARDL